MNKKRDSVIALLVVLSLCLLLGLAQLLPPGEMKGDSVYDHLQLGMSRAEVRPYMYRAWRRYECGSFREVYLFGPHDQVPSPYALEVIFGEQDGVDRLIGFGTISDSMFPIHVYDCDIYESPWETPWPNLFLVIPPAR